MDTHRQPSDDSSEEKIEELAAQRDAAMDAMRRAAEDRPYHEAKEAEKSSFGFYMVLGSIVVLLAVMVIWAAMRQSDNQATPGSQGAGPTQTQPAPQNSQPPVVVPTPPPVIVEKNNPPPPVEKPTTIVVTPPAPKNEQAPDKSADTTNDGSAPTGTGQ